MAGFVGLWPIVSAQQGDPETVQFGYAGGIWPFLGAVQGMVLFDGSISSSADVTGQARATSVRTAAAAAGAQVTGVDASSTPGNAGFVGLLPFQALQASTEVLPWGVGWSQASVTGQGVFSVLGDYVTPARCIWDIPPGALFKPPGVTLDYGVPVSIRLAAAQLGNIASVAAVTGAYAPGIARSGVAASVAAVNGQQRTTVVFSGAAASEAAVRGQAIGTSSAVELGSASSKADVTAVDRSLTQGVELGIAAAYSSVEGERRAEAVFSGAVASAAVVTAVDASSYPLAGVTGSTSTAASVTGEAVATIIRNAQAESRAVLSAVSASIAVAEAAAESMAHVSGYDAALALVTEGVGDVIGRRSARGIGSNIGRSAGKRTGKIGRPSG